MRMKIDAHQHFWEYSPEEYPWISERMRGLRRDFLPQHWVSSAKSSGMEVSVAVQARQTLQETEWLLALAEANPSVAGVVGWVDLRSPNLVTDLERFSSRKKLVGVRHVAQDEPDDQFLIRDSFTAGIAVLSRFKLAYDILIYPKQLPAAIALARKFPGQPFVLDHIAKPNIAEKMWEPWAALFRELGREPHVQCKLSGMVTEAHWHGWRAEEFTRYLDLAWETFGEDRLMFGSDWPVCLASASYEQVFSIISDYLSQFSQNTRDKVLGGNAARFYHL
ncbi:MAG: amidohydrolase family protein [Verrucomicrobiota bacterium]|nr:amidohydrolase family protein [Verrucomicrobiota bacterium]